MWNLTPDARGDLDAILDRALTYANGLPVYALSAVERGAVHTVYQLYDDLLGQPHLDLAPPELNGARQALQAAYDQVQVGGRLADLRVRLLASADICPYCGFGEPRDLDHYLPRSAYGELAIYPRNLIPSCNPCNNAKRAIVPGLDDATAPGFIHPYFQTLPDQDFLRADALYVDGALQVSFRIDAANIDPILAAKLQFQLDRLKLNERYPKRINTYLSEQRVGILQVGTIGEAALRTFLEASATSLSNDFGRNDWRVALLRALAAEVDFAREPELYLGPLQRPVA
ncbi:MAG: HNH endonuclease signature motif containing protein [Deltaproteobacteria bacterium]|nr:HNH endonuclease signature motif containing protein [Deltaproteobacteria bacterium]